jgi:ribose transport system ATP-binding protein
MESSPPAGVELAGLRARGAPRARSVLTLHDIDKSFPGVRALSRVSFDLRPGEVHALIGENGAGKSTLLKILSGAHAADAGRIAIDGREVVIDSPRRARQLGIAVIYQEPMLVPWLSVAHNLFLGREWEVGRGLLSLRRLHARARVELSRMGLDLDPAVPVAELGVAARQMVEIARALSEDARFLLMDEPTAALSEREVDVLFGKIAGLRDAGVGIAYISHRLEELRRVADRVTVLRDGAVVFTGALAGVTLDDLIAGMVGRPIGDHYPARTPAPGAEVIRIEPPAGAGRGRALAVRSGEVVGLAGLVGAGRSASSSAARRCGSPPPGTPASWVSAWYPRTARGTAWCCRGRCATISPSPSWTGCAGGAACSMPSARRACRGNTWTASGSAARTTPPGWRP